ncbi:MAG: nuclear transport factor 2 family protein [Chloroflexota bacterium]
MTDINHHELLTDMAAVIGRHDWDRLEDFYHSDAVLEYPQSGELFVGFANIRAQFANYRDLEPGTTELRDVIGGTDYALTPMYTVIAVEGSGNRGVALLRAHYPDQTWWWVINIYELRDGRIARARNFFAPEFDPPDWRAPFREKPDLPR